MSQSYYFARDDRIYRAFVERLEKHKAPIQRLLSRRLKWQLRVLKAVLEGRTTTFHVRLPSSLPVCEYLNMSFCRVKWIP